MRDGEQMHSVLGIPAASHICPLAHFHNEIESEKGEREGGEEKWNRNEEVAAVATRRLSFRRCFFIISPLFFTPPISRCPMTSSARA